MKYVAGTPFVPRDGADLDDRCREIFRLKLLGKSYVEIQQELGAASINTVYTWDARCRKELLVRLGGSWRTKA